MSRRSFLAGASAVGAVGVLGLNGCGVSRSGGIEYDLGSGDLVRVMNWPEYIDPTVEALIEQRAEMDVRYAETWEDNTTGWEEVILPSLGEGAASSWDIIVPTSWVAARMVDRGWAEPIPIEVIGNHANIDPAFLTQGWDRGARFQMPWQSGITGLAYNTTTADAEGLSFNSISDLFKPEFAGRVGMIGELREALGLVMLWLGDDPVRPTNDSVNRAMAELERLDAQQSFVWGFGEFVDGLAAGELIVSMAWSGDTALAQFDTPSLSFVVPDEGAIQWFDTMVIPKGSPNILAAGKWMNEIYNPEIAAIITSWNQYVTPVIGVREQLLQAGDSELANNPLVFPDDETQRRLFSFAGGLSEWEPSPELEQRFAAVTG